MKRYIVGIDISNKTLDYAIKTAERVSTPRRCANSWDGMEVILADLRAQQINPADCWFCFEHTGNYGLLLCSFLETEHLTYSMLPPLEIKQSMGMTRGKSDAIDAVRIAEYGYRFADKLKPGKLPGALLLRIRQLLTFRQQIVKMCTQVKNSLKSLQLMEPVMDPTFIREEKEAQLALLQEQKAKVEKQITQALQEDPEIEKNFNLLRSITGVGLIIAATAIGTTGNFTQFDNARQYNCYIGSAPFEHSSGTSYRGPTQTSALAHKTIRALLLNGCNSAIRHDPELAAYAARKLAEGKPERLVKNNVVNKLVARMFAVVNRGTPFITTYEKKV